MDRGSRSPRWQHCDVDGRPVLCAVADDDISHRVVESAAELARRLACDLVLAHVVEDVRSRSAGELLLADATVAAQLGTGVDRRVLVGGAVEELTGLARALDAALLVVGSRGRGALSSALLGSVSHGLAAGAPCPVVVVPAGIDAERG